MGARVVKITGTPVPHESARGHVTGEALYVDDFCGRYPNLLHAWPVCAPHAHALVSELDVSRVLEQRGVVTVLTQADVPGEGDSGANRHDDPLFPSEVLFYDQPTRGCLPRRSTPRNAARRGNGRVCAPACDPYDRTGNRGRQFPDEQLRIADGDPSRSTQARFCRRLLEIGGQEHFYLEKQAAIAWIDEAGFMAIHSSTQHPSETQESSRACWACPATM